MRNEEIKDNENVENKYGIRKEPVEMVWSCEVK